MSCSYCGEGGQKRIYCGTCTGTLFLRTRVSFIKALAQIASLESTVETVMRDSRRAIAITSTGPSDARTGLLDARILALQAKLDQTRRAVVQCRESTLQVREKSESIKGATAVAVKATAALRKSFANEQKSRIEHVKRHISELEKNYKIVFHQTLPLQSSSCEALLDLFMLKKKRRKNQQYDIVLGFNTIPEVCQLGHYPSAVINAGLERLAYFIVLLASYLGVHLPYAISLPSKSSAHVRIGPELQTLHLEHSVKATMRTAPREFHDYCGRLAMLSLDVAFVAARTGVPNSGFETTIRPNYLAAQLFLRLESYIKRGHQVQVHAVALNTDVEAVQDHYISAIDVDLNGRADEWNIVEAPEDEAAARS